MGGVVVTGGVVAGGVVAGGVVACGVVTDGVVTGGVVCPAVVCLGELHPVKLAKQSNSTKSAAVHLFIKGPPM